MVAPTAAISFALLAVVARAGNGGAGAGAAVRIQWNAPAGCSDAEAFFSGIQSRAERVRRAQAGEPALRLDVRVDRTSGSKVHGELRMADDRGRFELRKVDGGTCDEVVDALSLTVALALGASPTGAPSPAGSASPTSGPARAPEGAPTSPSPPSSPAAPPARSPAVAAPAPARDEAAPPPSEAARGAPAAVVPAEQGPTPEPPADARVDGSSTSNPLSSPSSIGLSLGLGPAAGAVTTPTFDLGGTALLRLGPRGDDSPRWSLGLSATHLRNDWPAASPEVAISWTALALTACPGWGIGGPVVVEICGTTAVGRLRANDRAVSVSTPSGRWWWSAGPMLRARVTLGWGFMVLVDAAAHVPLLRRTFVTSTPEERVAQTPAVAGVTEVLLAHPL